MNILKTILILAFTLTGYVGIPVEAFAQGKQAEEREQNVRGQDWLNFKEVKKVAREMRRASRDLRRMAREKPPRDASEVDLRLYAQDQQTVLQVADNLDVEASKWEEMLQTAGDDAQLANVDLQNMLQKQQQALQTLSNVSKMLHDTAMAIIRKIGG